MSTEESIFAAVTELSISERDAFLRQSCGDNSDMEDRIRVLLAAHDKQNGILDIAETLVGAPSKSTIGEGSDVGSYRLLQKLGEGGFGIVYMAEQRQPIQRQVALKVIKAGMDSKAVIARFEAERQALAMMDHPNIAKIFDGGESDKDHRPYFVMELVQGVPITEYCDANALNTQERLRLFITVCNAVHHAHQKGIIHRDLKPSNVMVTLHDGEPVIKVIDFGIAKALHQRLTEKTMFTHYGAMVGTPQYMSPEQAEMTGMDIDTRSDVYSLSVLLYELMTGTPPLQRESLQTVGYQEMQRMICEDEPVRPSRRLSSSGDRLTVLAKHRSATPNRLSKELQGDLDWIIMKGLEKDRNRRYDSANALAADVQRALDQQPVLAGPPTFTYQARKFAIRHRSRLAFVACIAMLALAVAAGLMNHRAHLRETQKKEEARLADAVDAANAGLVTAVDSSNSKELWSKAQLLVDRVDDLVQQSAADNRELENASKFLRRFARAQEDHEFTRSVEELLIAKSTDQDVDSLRFMEEQLRVILSNRGYDLTAQSPSEIRHELANDRSPVTVTDAMELWLATRIKLALAGGKEISDTEVRQWTKAMCDADPHPMRVAIRKVIFGTVPPDKQYLDEAVAQGDVSTTCARKLSWLADAFQIVGVPDRSEEIRAAALRLHPNDLMLNFDQATLLQSQGQWEQSIRYFMRCTAIRPGIPGVWKGLAYSLGQQNELRQACEALKMAIQLDENDATSHLQLSQWLLRDGQFESALSTAELSLSMNSELVDGWRVVGRSHMMLERYAQAIVAFEKFGQLANESDKASVHDWLTLCRKQIAARIDDSL